MSNHSCPGICFSALNHYTPPAQALSVLFFLVQEPKLSIGTLKTPREESVMDDTCDTCKAEYDYKPSNTVIVLYVNYPKANHLASKCPNGHLERVYAVPSKLEKMTAAPGFVVRVFEHAPAEMKEAADQAWYVATAPLRTKEVEVPNWMLWELFDQIRAFEHDA